MIEVVYLCRENDNPELVFFTKENQTYDEACKILDNYPWEAEEEWFEKTAEGGALYFKLQEQEEVYAYFQFTPIEARKGFVFMEIQLAKGFLGFLGKKHKELDFDTMNIAEFKVKLKELFVHSVRSLYEKS